MPGTFRDMHSSYLLTSEGAAGSWLGRQLSHVKAPDIQPPVSPESALNPILHGLAPQYAQLTPTHLQASAYWQPPPGSPPGYPLPTPGSSLPSSHHTVIPPASLSWTVCPPSTSANSAPNPGAGPLVSDPGSTTDTLSLGKPLLCPVPQLPSMKRGHPSKTDPRLHQLLAYSKRSINVSLEHLLDGGRQACFQSPLPFHHPTQGPGKA